MRVLISTSDARPAVARLHRTRVQLTVLITAITTLCMIVLGLVAAVIDARSRDQALDGALDRVLTGLAPRVYLNDDDSVDASDLPSDQLVGGEIAILVLTPDGTGGWTVHYGHLRSHMPAESGIAATADAATRAAGDTVYRDSIDSAGRRVRLATAVFGWEDSDREVVLITGADPDGWDRGRALLWWALIVGGTVMVAASAVGGHLLSGRSMRQALVLLDDQERFLSDAAHELRTPLATHRLATAPGRRTQAEAEQVLADVHALGAKMERVVTGLLARARMQSGVTTMERVQLLLDQLTESVVDEFDNPRLVLQPNPTVVMGDPHLLALAIRNLVENALTHGAVNPRAPVEIYVGEGRVCVRDHGTGLAPRLSSNPFDRGVTAGRGSGIGLALVAWIAELHGGTATIEPVAGGGTIATLLLPPPTAVPTGTASRSRP
ncbi:MULTISPECIES: sensor histidine kinase [unclassified Nocardia]|uniref:sensor histidine kinase n=1 Tax=unclassified Nocardia TaxID=2637762 RepID=UPI0033B6FF82